jgi:hypothetical protein
LHTLSVSKIGQEVKKWEKVVKEVRAIQTIPAQQATPQEKVAVTPQKIEEDHFLNLDFRIKE